MSMWFSSRVRNRCLSDSKISLQSSKISGKESCRSQAAWFETWFYERVKSCKDYKIKRHKIYSSSTITKKNGKVLKILKK